MMFSRVLLPLGLVLSLSCSGIATTISDDTFNSNSRRIPGVLPFGALATSTPYSMLLSGVSASRSVSRIGGWSVKFPQQHRRQDPTPTTSLDMRPTPDPTGAPSDETTIHITNASDFSLLLPSRQGGTCFESPCVK